MGAPEVILASASPRRRELLAMVVPAFRVETAPVEEVGGEGFSPADAALENARRKADCVADAHPGAVVIGCDTVVELDGKTLGKPGGRDEAAAMLRALSGRRHRVHTGVALRSPNGSAQFLAATTVDFAPLQEAEILRYIETDEPYDKAGGYGIQGWAARRIPRIEGCYYNVMGLPVAALFRQLCALGYADLCL